MKTKRTWVNPGGREPGGRKRLLLAVVDGEDTDEGDVGDVDDGDEALDGNRKQGVTQTMQRDTHVNVL